MSTESGGFLTGEVARFAGVTLRQLQWWDEKAVISPRQSGHRRIYSESEALQLSIIGELRRRNLSLRVIRKHGKTLRLAVASGVPYLLVTEKSMQRCFGPGEVVHLMKSERCPAYLICVEDHSMRLRGQLSKTAA